MAGTASRPLLYSRAKDAAMSPASFARESGSNEEELSWQVLVIVNISCIINGNSR